MGELSAADVLAMTRNGDNNSGFLEGNGIIILLLFMLFLGGGGGFGFGCNNGAASAAAQGALTRAEMQDGFNAQNSVNSFNNLNFALSNGFNSINHNIDTIGFNMQNCCCDIKTAIHSEGEATRALITKNTIDELNARLAEKDRELNAAIFTNSQQLQTRTLEDFIRANTAAPTATA